jgi:predicted nucleic acid-binding protein
MQLVVDTNILVSYFRDNPVCFIIINCDMLSLELFTPEYAIEELKENKSDILKYAKINSEQFNEALSELVKSIKIISKESFKQYGSEAKQLIHDKDIPIFALALKLKSKIWSNEPRFKTQSKIKIFNTQDLRQFLGEKIR